MYSSEEVQQITGHSAELAYVDQGYTRQTAGDALCERKRSAHTTGANGTVLLECWFYGCLVPHLYNCDRPHSALDYRTPMEFKLALEGSRAMARLPSPTATSNTTENLQL